MDRDGRIDVIVHDDGGGFDPRAASPGFGLIGMRERLALVQGSLDLESTPGAGTRLHASIPARPRDQATATTPSSRSPSGASTPRGTTTTGQAASRSTRPLTPPTSTDHSGP